MDAPSPEPQPRTPPPRKRTWRRRVLGVSIAVVVLLLLAAIVTQIVLWTNVPRDLVLSQLEKQLGLRVSAESLTTGWLGNTHLHKVAIALPLSEESLLRVPDMRVEHTSLLGLLLTRSVSLDAVELSGPHLIVRQDAAGRWNLQDVADLLARTGGKQTASEQATRSSRPKLPSVRVTDATVEVIDRAGRTATIFPIRVNGEPEDALTWKYDVAIGAENSTGSPDIARATVVGRLATGGSWEHQVDLAAQHVEAWAKPFVGEGAPPVSIQAKWEGQLRGGGIVGRMVLTKLDIADLAVTGAIDAASEDGAAALRPAGLIVQTNRKAIPEVRLTGGKLVLDGKGARTESLTILTFNGAARVDGNYDWRSGSADMKASWSDFAVPGQRVTHGGSLDASLRSPLPGKPIVQARVISNGSMPSRQWAADFSIGGSGSSWSNMDWELQANRLALLGAQPAKLDGLAATAQTRGDLISLTSVRGPGEVIARGRGQFNQASRDWNVRIDLSNLPRPLAFGRKGPLAITLNAKGTPEYIRLEEPGLSIRGTEAEVRLEGWYVYDVPKPVDLDVYINHIPPRIETGDQPPLFGYLRGEAHLSGTVYPTHLDITGNLVGRDVRFLDRPIGEIQAAVTGKVDDERMTLRTNRLKLLGGEWELDGVFPENGILALNLNVNDLSLQEAGEVLKRPGASGEVNGRIAILVPRLDPDAIKLTANIKGNDLKVGKLFSADTLEATAALADGSLSVDPVRLTKGEGQAEATAEMDIRAFRRLTASLALAAWPFEPSPGTKAELTGGTSGIRLTLPGATREEGIRRGVFQPEMKANSWWITGPIDLGAKLTLKDKPFGDARLQADLRGRTLDLQTLSLDGLEGKVKGQGTIDFDRLFETRAELSWDNFNAERLSDFFPDNDSLVGLVGRFSGNASIGPAPGPRPIGPLRVTARMSSDGGKYRSIDIGESQLSLFTNFDRFVVQDSVTNPTTIGLAGGLVRIWGRTSILNAGDELQSTPDGKPLYLSQMQVSFGRLDLDQIVHAFSPDAEPMPGKVSGSFEALAGTRLTHRQGDPPSLQTPLERAIRRITADGRIELTESNLGNLDVVAFLYNAMSVIPAAETPDGHGDLTFHLEDGLLALSNIHYFNRGTELRAVVDIDKVWQMPNSSLLGSAVGTARPFKDLKVPLITTYNLDELLTVLQTDLTTVGITGTVKDPKIHSLTLSDVGEGMRNLLLGDFDKEKQKRGRVR